MPSYAIFPRSFRKRRFAPACSPLLAVEARAGSATAASRGGGARDVPHRTERIDAITVTLAGGTVADERVDRLGLERPLLAAGIRTSDEREVPLRERAGGRHQRRPIPGAAVGARAIRNAGRVEIERVQGHSCRRRHPGGGGLDRRLLRDVGVRQQGRGGNWIRVGIAGGGATAATAPGESQQQRSRNSGR